MNVKRDSSHGDMRRMTEVCCEFSRSVTFTVKRTRFWIPGYVNFEYEILFRRVVDDSDA